MARSDEQRALDRARRQLQAAIDRDLPDGLVAYCEAGKAGHLYGEVHVRRYVSSGGLWVRADDWREDRGPLRPSYASTALYPDYEDEVTTRVLHACQHRELAREYYALRKAVREVAHAR